MNAPMPPPAWHAMPGLLEQRSQGKTICPDEAARLMAASGRIGIQKCSKFRKLRTFCWKRAAPAPHGTGKTAISGVLPLG